MSHSALFDTYISVELFGVEPPSSLKLLMTEM